MRTCKNLTVVVEEKRQRSLLLPQCSSQVGVFSVAFWCCHGCGARSHGEREREREREREDHCDGGRGVTVLVVVELVNGRESAVVVAEQQQQQQQQQQQPQ